MNAPTLTDLLLAVSHAESMERWHQRVCLARASEQSCVACMEYEADWYWADLALAEFRGRVRVGRTNVVTGGRYGEVGR